jgi:hypothetical protein
MTVGILADRAGMTSSTTGTGTLTLSGALGAAVVNTCSYQSFATAGITNGQTVSYLILDANGDWEVGRGVYTSSGTTLSRSPLYSSNGGAAINLSGSEQIFITALAEDLVTTITAGSGISITGGPPNYTAALKLNSATTNATPAAPSSTTSMSRVMMGLGKDQAGGGASPCSITPVYSGRVQCIFYGYLQNTSADFTNTLAYFGTGTAPSNGASPTGTSIGTSISVRDFGGFANGAILTGLTPGTAYWFDQGLEVASGGTALISNITCMLMEF